MVGAAGIVASTINNRNHRRESRSSAHGGDDHNYRASRATISDSGGGRAGSAAGPYREIFSYTYPRTSSAAGPPTTPNPTQPPPTDLEIVPEKMSLAEQVKFYSSLALGIVASLCVFALLFLIPLVVEPSISTILADFDPTPATCVTVDYTSATGLSKCGLWSSCREGCTSTPSQCHQIYVSYRRPNKKGFPKLKNFTVIDPHDWLDESRWDVSYTQLLINAKGCGYPPRVKCDEFGDTYGLQGRTFPCFYSRANPRLVVTDYNWEEAAQPLILALGVPTALFAASISILSFWYCPSCEERGKNKRPCRSRYQTARNQDVLDELQLRQRNVGSSRAIQPPPPPSAAILQQPATRGKTEPTLQQQRTPSLATISSRDTTVSSVNSMDDGWQSPPSPPPRMNSTNMTTRVRKL